MSIQVTSPWSGDLDEGNYTITAPASVSVGAAIYDFQRWDDNSTGLTRSFSLIAAGAIVAYYVLRPPVTHTLSIDSTPVQGITFTLTKIA